MSTLPASWKQSETSFLSAGVARKRQNAFLSILMPFNGNRQNKNGWMIVSSISSSQIVCPRSWSCRRLLTTLCFCAAENARKRGRSTISIFSGAVFILMSRAKGAGAVNTVIGRLIKRLLPCGVFFNAASCASSSVKEASADWWRKKSSLCSVSDKTLRTSTPTRRRALRATIGSSLMPTMSWEIDCNRGGVSNGFCAVTPLSCCMSASRRPGYLALVWRADVQENSRRYLNATKPFRSAKF